MEGSSSESSSNHRCCCVSRIRSLTETSSDHFSDYCRDSGIHGFQYIGDRSRPKPERILWVILLVFSIGASAYMIREVWLKWERSPVLVTFAETSLPVWQVPFPAVTLCSETKSRQRVFNYTEAYNNKDNITGDTLRNFEDITLLCDEVDYTKGNPLFNASTVELFKKVAPSLEDTIIYVYYQKFDGNYASRLFRPLLTQEGICFTFNMLNATDFFTEEVVQLREGYLDYEEGRTGWSPDFGYDSSANIAAYPRRALGSGVNNGIYIYLNVSQDDIDYACRGALDGFKIQLHNPAEVPRIGEHFISVPLSHHVTVSVRPTMITTSQGLRDYLPHRRQCYFSYERKLRYFQHYTQENCYMECMTNNTFKMCGCVSFYMPRTEGVPICGTGSTECVEKSQEELVRREVEKGLRANGKTNTTSDKCDCLPACTSLEYDTETSVAHMSVKKQLIAIKSNFPHLQRQRFASISIYFKDMQFIPSRRSELYGRTDFLANCGGLLGLFLGFSVLSLVEIVYYFSVRICCSIYIQNKVAPSSHL